MVPINPFSCCLSGQNQPWILNATVLSYLRVALTFCPFFISSKFVLWRSEGLRYETSLFTSSETVTCLDVMVVCCSALLSELLGSDWRKECDSIKTKNKTFLVKLLSLYCGKHSIGRQ